MNSPDYYPEITIGGSGLSLGACGESQSDDVVEQGARQGAGAVDPSEDGSTAQADAGGQLLESGFGQNGQYVQAVALVKNSADHAGQTVTVSVNFLAADGSIITTESQVDSFNFPLQTIASQIFTDLGDSKAKVSAIEPTLLIEDEGTFEETDVDFGTVEGTDIKEEYGSWSADFLITNPTAEPLESPAVRVACRDAAGTIIGGGFDFPDLVPPDGQVVSQPSLTVSGKPASCTAYVGGPIF